jgi:hypothetical protein
LQLRPPPDVCANITTSGKLPKALGDRDDSELW